MLEALFDNYITNSTNIDNHWRQFKKTNWLLSTIICKVHRGIFEVPQFVVDG